jgi:SAM-dependent methyltransferase
VLATLAGAGIVQVAGDRVGPRLPVVLRRGRPYLMSLRAGGDGDPYTQELWPETDALLARVDAAAPGTLLDVGTGSGAVAIEAALRGHTATGSDLFADALELAAWNAELHGVPLELLRGHMLEPAAGRRFDLVLSAPHYGREADLLRVEMLREGVAHVAPGGALFVVTFLEWQAADLSRVGVVEQLLRPLAERGAAVTVRPLPRGARSRWFRVPTSDDDPRVPSRHRFAIEIRPDGPAGLDVRLPGEHELEREHVVPLARLSRRGDALTTATVTTPDDRAALEALLAQLATGTLRVDAPFFLLEACRWGAARCSAAHGAIVDSAGVRPCTHGEPVGTIADTARSFHARMERELAAVEQRRGCATCPARGSCSRCLFPSSDEATYCATVIRHHARLPLLHRALRLCWPHAGARRLALKLAPGGPLVAAHHRPPSVQDHELAPIAAWVWASTGTLLVADDAAFLHLSHDFEQAPLELTLEAAELVELLLDGCSPESLRAYADARGFGGGAPGLIDALVAVVAGWVVA